MNDIYHTLENIIRLEYATIDEVSLMQLAKDYGVIDLNDEYQSVHDLREELIARELCVYFK